MRSTTTQTSILACCALFAMALPQPASAFMQLARGSLRLDTSLTGTYDSYFIGDRDFGDEYYATLRPQLTYSRSAGLGSFGGGVGVAVNRYQMNKRYDSEDKFGNFQVTLPLAEGSRLAGALGASYSESTQADQIILDRIRSTGYSGNAQFSYVTGPKTSISDSFTYNQSDRDVYGKQTMWGNSFAVLYRDFWEDTNARFSYDYNRAKSSGSDLSQWVFDPEAINYLPDVGIDQTSHSFTLGAQRPIYGAIIGDYSLGYRVLKRAPNETFARTTNQKSIVYTLGITGPFLPPARYPKVESSASLSYQQSLNPGINDTGEKTLTGDIRLAWNARDRTRLSFAASRMMGLASNNFTSVTTTLNAAVTQTVGLSTTLNGSMDYTWRSYRGYSRNDNMFTLTGSINRPLTKFLRASATYSYQQNNTSATGFQPSRYAPRDYTRHLVSVSLSNTF